MANKTKVIMTVTNEQSLRILSFIYKYYPEQTIDDLKSSSMRLFLTEYLANRVLKCVLEEYCFCTC